MIRKNLGFTLAEVLIVIGIIGVVAALTLPNLNHATGDKETVTRLKKAHATLSEATDRAVAIYGPISEWERGCSDINLKECYLKRISEFLKPKKFIDLETDGVDECRKYLTPFSSVIVLSDDITIGLEGSDSYFCDITDGTYDDICFDEISVDVNGKNKGKNNEGDVFEFMYSEKSGMLPMILYDTHEKRVYECMDCKNSIECTWWVLDYGNLDYLKADRSGKCNDSNIILDGTTNTSCH